ncbi:hypothetical protein P5704_023525 [Pseudomonas sp. FeN3W]|nr:hypothetical protein P5704_023525 [Pseudomonas sp. FeN3W]
MGGVEFDGVHPEKRLSLLLAHKLDMTALKAFIDASVQFDLKPVVIFNAKAFERYQFEDYRLKHPKRSDNGWISSSLTRSQAISAQLHSGSTLSKASIRILV